METPPSKATVTMLPLLDRYLTRRNAERGLSTLTRRNYTTDITAFFAYCDAQGLDPLALNRNSFRDFLGHLAGTGVAPDSIRRKVSTVHGLYRFLAREGVLATDPLGGVKPPKKRQRLPQILAEDEIRRLVDAPATDNAHGLRDRAILELLYAAGLRISELTGVQLRQVDLDERTVRVTGKGNKQRVALFGAPAEVALRRYVGDARPEIARAARRPSPSLFLNRFGTTLTPRAVQIMVAKYATAAGIDAAVHPHLFRHSFATHLLDNGAELRVVQELMGHTSADTTQIYLHVTGERKREIYDRAMAHGRLSLEARQAARSTPTRS